jgi:hypothetical protein
MNIDQLKATKYINQDMTAEEMAYVIFYNMDMLASCKVEGIVKDSSDGRWKPKGQIVCDLLYGYDRKHNTKYRGAQDGPRIKRKPPNSIGGYLADKIFRWRIDRTETTIKYSIWRIQ